MKSKRRKNYISKSIFYLCSFLIMLSCNDKSKKNVKRNTEINLSSSSKKIIPDSSFAYLKFLSNINSPITVQSNLDQIIFDPDKEKSTSILYKKIYIYPIDMLLIHNRTILSDTIILKHNDTVQIKLNNKKFQFSLTNDSLNTKRILWQDHHIFPRNAAYKKIETINTVVNSFRPPYPSLSDSIKQYRKINDHPRQPKDFEGMEEIQKNAISHLKEINNYYEGIYKNINNYKDEELKEFYKGYTIWKHYRQLKSLKDFLPEKLHDLTFSSNQKDQFYFTANNFMIHDSIDKTISLANVMMRSTQTFRRAELIKS